MRASIRLLYAIAIAAFLVMAVGFGTLTFYPGPDQPEYPIELQYPKAVPAAAVGVAPTPDPKMEEAQRRYDADQKAYQQAERVHGGNVMLVAAAAALVAIALGLAASSLLDVLRVGAMLGGLLTAVWGVIYAATVNAADRRTIFIATLFGLILLAILSTERARLWLGRTLRLGAGDDLLR